MRFKLADPTQAIDAIAWRPLQSVSPGPQRANHREASVPAPAATHLFEQQVAELEQRHQANLAAARQEGFHQGIQQARNEAMSELKAGTDRVANALADLATTKRRLRNESEMEMLKLSLAIARRILHRELMSDPEALHGLVHAALQKLQNREVSRVRVFPAGADAIRAALERIGAAPAITVFPDSTLKSGDLIFETSFGDLDTSIDTQLQEIQRGFADRLAIR